MAYRCRGAQEKKKKNALAIHGQTAGPRHRGKTATHTRMYIPAHISAFLSQRATRERDDFVQIGDAGTRMGQAREE